VVRSGSVVLVDADRLKAMYRRWLLEVWGAGRYAIADELLHIDLVDHNRYDGQPDGRAGDVWAAQMVRRAFPDLRFVPDLVMSDGGFVVGRWTMTGTNTGTMDLFALPPTGRPVTMTGQEVFVLRADCLLRSGIRRTCPACSPNSGYSPRRWSCDSPPARARGDTVAHSGVSRFTPSRGHQRKFAQPPCARRVRPDPSRVPADYVATVAMRGATPRRARCR
jgi:predicted ester cyclase